MRSFDAARLRPQCCAFHPKGTLLAIGFNSGACKILDSSDLAEVASFRYTPAPLSSIRFSPDGETVSPYIFVLYALVGRGKENANWSVHANPVNRDKGPGKMLELRAIKQN